MSRSSRARPSSSRHRAGYTMVEVMMGLAILAVGAAAIVSLQRFAVMGTMTSRHLTNATNIAASVIEAMDRESGRWTDVASVGAATMPWLGTALDSENNWIAPAIRGARIDGTPVDVSTVLDTDEVAYCTHVRAVYLGDPAAVGGLNEPDGARVEVRTFWAKSGRTVAPECRDLTGTEVMDLFNNNDQTVIGIDRNRAEYGVVYLTTIIRRSGE